MSRFDQKMGIGIILLFSIVFSTAIVVMPMVRASSPLTIWYVEDEYIDDTFLALIDQFETEKGVVVNVVHKNAENIRMDFKTAFIMGTEPDIIQADSAIIPDLVHKDMLLPLKDSDFAESYLDGAKRAVSYFYREESKYLTDTLAYYGYPQSIDTMAFIYNKDNATSATIPQTSGSWTMSQFKSQVTKMNDQSIPSDKQFGMTYINFLETAEALFLGAKGIMFSNYVIDAANDKIDSTLSKAALSYIYNFTNVWELTPSYKTGYYVDAEKNLIYDRIYQDFVSGGNISSSMLFARQLKKLMATGIFSDSSKLGIAPSPQDDTGIAPFLDVRALMISSNSENQDIAKNLSNFLTSKSAMIENAKNESILPAILECYDNSELSTNSIIQSYKPLVQRASPKYLSRFWIPVEDIFKTQTQTMIRGGPSGETTAVALKTYWEFEILGVADTPGIGSDLSAFERWGTVKEKKIPGFPLISVVTISCMIIFLKSFLILKKRQEVKV